MECPNCCRPLRPGAWQCAHCGYLLAEKQTPASWVDATNPTGPGPIEELREAEWAPVRRAEPIAAHRPQAVAPAALPHASVDPSEELFYQDATVTVTRVRLVVNGAVYAMAHITSARVLLVPADRSNGVITAIVGGLVMVFGGSLDTITLVVGVILTAVGISLALRQFPKYMVRIGSSSGERSLVWYREARRAQAVVDAVNAAFLARG